MVVILVVTLCLGMASCSPDQGQVAGSLAHRRVTSMFFLELHPTPSSQDQ